MQTFVRERVGVVTAVLSVVSVGLVFAAAGQRIPQSILPQGPDWLLEAIPHVNVLISIAAIGTIAAGLHAIRNGRIDRHRTLMGTAFGLFVGFLCLYLYRVSLLGPQPFSGPDTVYQFVYLPTLAIHILLAVVCIPLLYYVLLLALTRPIHELPETRHPTVGRVAAALWLISFTLGVVVYLFTHVLY